MRTEPADDCDSCHGLGYYYHDDVEYKCSCWVSKSALAKLLRKNLACLAANLRVAAGLCKAFELGNEEDEGGNWPWWPGCQRVAP